MASVDDRIVRMEFDNASFERKVGTTLTSLDKLNHALKFEGAGKGLADVSAQADKFNLAGIGSAVENISAKFQALSVIAITALANITTKAIQSGIQLGKSLSLDQIISGFQEYETNMNSIQTILANTKSEGATLDQVNNALDQLNTYSDQTIYNFSQMARNIGTFTAAGVGLQDSVNAIKGIANLAAISGSNSEQASTAMYQLSQALAAGKVSLMDWNSVVNAGMGGEVFKKALFETGKALGTIADVPLSASFEDWERTGGTFREQMQEGWITADVLRTTLGAFSGDLDAATLSTMGFSDAAAQQMVDLGALGIAAATEVKTFTQLLSTIKESVGSGWAESFRNVIGNFEQAKELFTNVNNAIGGFVSRSADARNEILRVWAFMGGRNVAIEALTDAFHSLMAILNPIKEAFREIFPRRTGQELFALTERFRDFIATLRPSQETIDNIRRIFKGLFAALDIGWEIIKAGVGFIRDLIGALVGLGGGPLLEFGANIGDFFVNLREWLIQGEGLTNFFEGLKAAVQAPLAFIIALKDTIIDFFSNLDADVPDAVGESFGRFGERLGGLQTIVDRLRDVWGPFIDALQRVGEILANVWEEISGFFSSLGQKIADIMGESDWDAVADALNVGLLAVIAGVLARFLRSGFTFDLGGGFFASIKQTFEELTGVLTAMQTSIRADALMKIAIAIGILTASVVALSLIDSVALTRAMGAMAVGFGQLMAAFAILSKITMSPMSAVSFGLVSTGMIVMSTAILILTAAASNLADLDWDELARGLTGVTVLLGLVLGFIALMKTEAPNLIAAGTGILILAVGLNILAGAVKIFATMSWTEMGQGLLGVAAALGIIAGAVQLMPSGAKMLATGASILLLGIALNILAAAVKVFSLMDLEQLGTGFLAIGAGLAIIAGAMHLFPGGVKMVAIGVGLLLVSVSLNAIASAMLVFSTMEWNEIGRGLVAMGGALLVIAGACQIMQGAIGGAIAIGIVSLSLMALFAVLKAFASLDTDELIQGLLAIVATLAAIGAVALLLGPAVGAMMALGVALLFLGAGFALFGLGAMAVAKAFEYLARAGAAGSEALVEALKAVGRALPAMAQGFAEGILELARTLMQAAPELIGMLGELIVLLLDKIVELIPEILQVVGELISGILGLIREKVPEYIATGLFLLVSFLQGIRDNIGQVVTIVGEIITNFIDALSEQLTSIVQSVADLFVNFITTVAEEVGRISATIMFGMAAAFIRGFVEGLDAAIPGPMSWFLELPGKVISWIGDVLSTLWQKGSDLITGLFNGVKNAIGAVTSWFSGLVGSVIGWIGDALGALYGKGRDLISGLWNGIRDAWLTLRGWLQNLGGYVLDAIGSLANKLYSVGRDLINGLWDGIKAVWRQLTGWISDAAGAIVDTVKGVFDVFSPSRVFMEIGENVMLGLKIGMEEEYGKAENWLSKLDPVSALDENMNDRMRNVFDSIVSQLGDMDEFNPVITPILDLTKVQTDAQRMAGYINAANSLNPDYSYSQAQSIASGTRAQAEEALVSSSGATEIKFEQTINAPTQLSTSDIYKQTRNQITMAKEELKIP